MKIIETIFNAETQLTEIIEREMTAEEEKEWQDLQTKKIAMADEQAKALEAKEAAEAKLVALGLNADDIRALGL
jgi:hypothetical protein